MVSDFFCEDTDAVKFIQRVLKKIPVRNAEHQPYTFYGPGEMPFFNFYVWVTDHKCKLVRDRFPKLIKALNVSLRKGYIKVTQIHTEEKSHLNEGRPAFRLKVRVEDTLLEPLRALHFRPRFVSGPVHFLHPAKVFKDKDGDHGKKENRQETLMDQGSVIQKDCSDNNKDNTKEDESMDTEGDGAKA